MHSWPGRALAGAVRWASWCSGAQDTYISTTPSGKLAGISVRPFARQSTMLLLQVQADGQESELALQDGGSEWGAARTQRGQSQVTKGNTRVRAPGHLQPSASFLRMQHHMPSNMAHYHQLTSLLPLLPWAEYSTDRKDADSDLSNPELFHLLFYQTIWSFKETGALRANHT